MWRSAQGRRKLPRAERSRSEKGREEQAESETTKKKVTLPTKDVAQQSITDIARNVASYSAAVSAAVEVEVENRFGQASVGEQQSCSEKSRRESRSSVCVHRSGHNHQLCTETQGRKTRFNMYKEDPRTHAAAIDDPTRVPASTSTPSFPPTCQGRPCVHRHPPVLLRSARARSSPAPRARCETTHSSARS